MQLQMKLAKLCCQVFEGIEDDIDVLYLFSLSFSSIVMVTSDLQKRPLKRHKLPHNLTYVLIFVLLRILTEKTKYAFVVFEVWP